MNRFTIARALAVAGVASACVQVAQAQLSISEVPLFLRAGTTPNIVVTIDDSGSMARGYVPDAAGDSSTKRNSPKFTAASYNAMYYNPAVSYAIPTRTDGVSYTTSFTAAPVNGFDPSRGTTNLQSNGYRPIHQCLPSETQSTCTNTSNSTPGAGGGTTTTTTNYAYTCRAFFNDRGGRNDRIDATNCTPAMPASGEGSPQEADNATITVTGAGTASYNRTYTVSGSSEISAGVRIDLNSRTQIGQDATFNNVVLRWTQTETQTVTSGPAYYHLYYTDKPGASRPSGCNDNRETNACYVYVQVGSADDITPGTADQKRQNFAIWYSFYRTRALATMSAAMNAVTSLGSNQVRLGWQTLNRCTSFGTTCTGYDGVNRENRIRSLDALKTGSTTVTHRTDFYDWIARLAVSGATPLRSAMERAGSYFSVTGQDSPYAEEPHVKLGTQLSCRRNFHLLMTDGLWNSDANTDFGGNVDSTNRTLPDGTTYSPRYPYRDPPGAPPTGLSYSNTLADIAFKFWSTDLVNLTDNLNPYVVDRSGTASDQYWNPRNNPARWQHMTNFVVSFGLGGALVDPAWGGSTFAGDYPALAAGTKGWLPVNEAAASSASPEDHVYDLWHAAINSRGEFLNAEDPAGIARAFQSVFNSILEKNPSSAALAANSTSIQTGTLVYQAKFDSADWSGQLLAYGVNSDGSVGPLRWDASTLIPAASARRITTWNGSAGLLLDNCATLGDLATILNRTPAGAVDNRCPARLAWLRGDAAQELRRGGAFRNRTKGPLGDIINSDPAYVKNEDYGYAATGSAIPERTSYAAFVASKANRVPAVYVGANDGMLHAFRADVGATESGRELFAHVPKGVHARLNRVMEPAYQHLYFVDGSPSVGDAYLSGGWKTVLVSGLGAGGRSVFALDVTDPTAHGPTKVLWEYEEADLGLTFSQPQIARLPNGTWAAVFGNGYNSTVGRAYLYVVDLASGALIRKIAAGTATANGLSTPALHDANGDRIIDTVYAGDLQGNLWKFDLSSSNPASWGVTGGVPFFQARNAANQVQPITTKPVVTAVVGQAFGGVMVLFGTGRYLTDTDPQGADVQSFYGVLDNGTTSTVTRSQLRVQSITAETNQFGYTLRETSANTVDWATQRGWYMDLVGPGVAATGPGGERIVSNPIVRYDRVIFVTTIPSTDVCEPGGTGWLMEVDYLTGSRTTVSAFDFNRDNLFNAGDLLASGNTASGVRSTEGILKTPAWLEQEPTSPVAIKQMSGSSGGIFVVANRKPANVGGTLRRIYWQQIR